MAKTALFKARMCPNLNCISIMMSCSACMTGLFMNFELLPILTDYANLKTVGMKFKKNLLLGNY
jgi:glutaredoxin-related protein